MRTLFFTLALLLTPSLAQAQTSCGPLEQAESSLRDNFAEKPLIEWDVQLSEGTPTRTIRAYANVQTGSLTLLMIFEHEGKAIGCLAGSGKNMRIAPQFKAAEHPL
jgi:hypothetical protein